MMYTEEDLDGMVFSNNTNHDYIILRIGGEYRIKYTTDSSSCQGIKWYPKSILDYINNGNWLVISLRETKFIYNYLIF